MLLYIEKRNKAMMYILTINQFFNEVEFDQVTKLSNSEYEVEDFLDDRVDLAEDELEDFI